MVSERESFIAERIDLNSTINIIKLENTQASSQKDAKI